MLTFSKGLLYSRGAPGRYSLKYCSTAADLSRLRSGAGVNTGWVPSSRATAATSPRGTAVPYSSALSGLPPVW